jgi:MOSC domain-containing protein YiiM
MWLSYLNLAVSLMLTIGIVMVASIKKIYIAKKGAKPISRALVGVEANKGVVGDRYYHGAGTFSEKLAGHRKSEITFIASEEIDNFNAAQNEALDYGDARRNVVTQGVQLAELIGKEFTIGSAKFLGIEHCEPCAHLASTVNKKVLPHLVHTGLRAAILESGQIEVGHAIVS